MGHSGWASGMQWALWFIIMSAVMGWLGRSRLKPRPASEAGLLRQPAAMLAVGVICVVFFAALAVLSGLFARDATWWTTTAFLAFAMMGAPIIADYYLGRHEVSDDGLDYGGMFGRRGSMRWGDVRAVRYGNMMKWFRLEDAHGNVARLSAMLIGLPEFARLALRHVPAEALDGATWDLLEQTANGNPPRIWY